MMLVEALQLALDAPIKTGLPEFSNVQVAQRGG
jgi:hypothetical protein